MDNSELQNVALAYTLKSTSARTPEDFLAEYETNKKVLQKIEEAKPLPKARIHNRADFGL